MKVIALGWAVFFCFLYFLGRLRTNYSPVHNPPPTPGFRAEKPSSRQQRYLLIIFPVPLKIHAAIRTALNEGPPTSIGFHVTENLRALVGKGVGSPRRQPDARCVGQLKRDLANRTSHNNR